MGGWCVVSCSHPTTHTHHTNPQVALTLAGGYLSFYTANIAHLSGVVSVAVFGLHGAATSTWDMPPAARPAFEAFWDALSFTANAIVFFFTGVAVVNFLLRAAQRMDAADAAAGAAENGAHRLWVGLWRFPIVYALIFGLRFALLTVFRPLFRLEGSDLPPRDAAFATIAGLRGSVALILAQAVMTGDVGTDLGPTEVRVSSVGVWGREVERERTQRFRTHHPHPLSTRPPPQIRSEIVLWTALFVLCTLIVNAPLLPRVLSWTGLDAVPAPRRALRGKALAALDAHTDAAVAALRAQEDEMLAGVDWARVRDMVRVSGAPVFAVFEGPPLKGTPRPQDATAPGRALVVAGTDATAPGRALVVAGTDAWAWVADAAVAVATCGGRLTRRGRAAAAAADVAAALPGRALKSARSMANLFLEDTAKPVSRHNRVFGRAITMTSEAGGDDDASLPGDSDIEAGLPDDDAPSADPNAVNWEDVNQMTVDASSVPFLPIRSGAGGASATPRATLEALSESVPSTLPSSSVAPGDVEVGSPSTVAARSTTPAGASTPGRSPRAVAPLPPPDPAMHPRLVHTEAGYLPDPSLFRPTATESTATVASVTAAAARARASLTRPSLTRPSPLPGGGGGSATGSGDASRPATAATATRLDALWREQEATLGAALTSPTSSLTAARPPPRHRSVFEAFNIARPGEEGGVEAAAGPAGDASRRRTLTNSGDGSALDARRSSGGGSDHGADAARRALAAAAAPAPPGSTWTAGMTRGVSPLAALGAAGGGGAAAAVAALEAPTLAEADAAVAATRGVLAPSARRAVAWDDAALAASRGSGRSDPTASPPTPHLASTDSMHAAAGRALKSALSRVASTMRPRAASTHLEELRVRVAAGLKRHFGAKRAAGLLSARALRVLDTACAEAIDAPASPLALWAAVERDVTARITARVLARAALACRRAKAAIAGPPASTSILAPLRRAIAWPLAKAARAMLWHLSRAMLVACEAAMEMMLALTFAPGAALTVVSGDGAPASSDPDDAASYAAAVASVADECDAQLRQVWLFLHDREAEAPERFQAVQTYRATMAVMRRQAAFVKAMFESGAVDADERDALLAPLAAREHALERRGPFWRAPAPADVLRELPFVRGRADVASFFLARSTLRVHPSTTVASSKTDDTAPTSTGFIVVIGGLVRVSAGGRVGGRADVYLGCGGVTGLLSALTGVEWGAWAAVAEGNALGKGPLVLHVSQDAVDEVRERSAGELVWGWGEVRRGGKRHAHSPPPPPPPTSTHSRQRRLPAGGGRHVPHGLPVCGGAREAAPHGLSARRAGRARRRAAPRRRPIPRRRRRRPRPRRPRLPLVCAGAGGGGAGGAAARGEAARARGGRAVARARVGVAGGWRPSPHRRPGRHPGEAGDCFPTPSRCRVRGARAVAAGARGAWRSRPHPRARAPARPLHCRPRGRVPHGGPQQGGRPRDRALVRGFARAGSCGGGRAGAPAPLRGGRRRPPPPRHAGGPHGCAVGGRSGA